MKKSEIRKLDILWSKKVKEIAGHKCEYCNQADKRLESAHIIGRSSWRGGRATRWGCWIDGQYDLNGMCLCIDHHKDYDEHKPLHNNIFNNVVGLVRWHKLCDVGITIAKHQDYNEIKKWIEEK